MAPQSQVFLLKRGDTSPSLRFALSPASVNLVGSSVVFNMAKADGTVKVSRAPAVIETATGTPTVRYDWQAGDTSDTGDFVGEFEVLYGTGQRETFPNGDEFIPILIGGDIA